MEFVRYGKTTRIDSEVIVTEKLNGSNCGLIIVEADYCPVLGSALTRLEYDDKWWLVGTQSRNRLLTLEEDHQEFAAWVFANAHSLVRDLGKGVHFGEWSPAGNKHTFWLFNAARWTESFETDRLRVVPLLYRGDFYKDVVADCWDKIAERSLTFDGLAEGLVVTWLADQSKKKLVVNKPGASRA